MVDRILQVHKQFYMGRKWDDYFTGHGWRWSSVPHLFNIHIAGISNLF